MINTRRLSLALLLFVTISTISGAMAGLNCVAWFGSAGRL